MGVDGCDLEDMATFALVVASPRRRGESAVQSTLFASKYLRNEGFAVSTQIAILSANRV